MTANQIAYWRLQEEKRANQAKESETIRSNLEKESQGRIGLGISEKQAQASLAHASAASASASAALKQANVAEQRMFTEALYADMYASAAMAQANAAQQRADTESMYAGTYANAAATNAGANLANSQTSFENMKVNRTDAETRRMSVEYQHPFQGIDTAFSTSGKILKGFAETAQVIGSLFGN